MNTGGRIRQARVARGFSMRALASRVGVSPAAIAKYEHGESIPRPSVLLRLAREIGVDTGYFFRRIQVELRTSAYRKHGRFPIKVQHSIEAVVANALESHLTLAAASRRFRLQVGPLRSLLATYCGWPTQAHLESAKSRSAISAIVSRHASFESQVSGMPDSP